MFQFALVVLSSCPLDHILKRILDVMKFLWVFLVSLTEDIISGLKSLCKDSLDISKVLRFERALLSQQQKKVMVFLPDVFTFICGVWVMCIKSDDLYTSMLNVCLFRVKMWLMTAFISSTKTGCPDETQRRRWTSAKIWERKAHRLLQRWAITLNSTVFLHGTAAVCPGSWVYYIIIHTHVSLCLLAIIIYSKSF